MLSRILFALACVAIPILWGIAVNWLFGRLQSSAPQSPAESDGIDADSESKVQQDEPVIEYYI